MLQSTRTSVERDYADLVHIDLVAEFELLSIAGIEQLKAVCVREMKTIKKESLGAVRRRQLNEYCDSAALKTICVGAFGDD